MHENFIYWPDLNQSSLEQINFEKNSIQELIPIFRSISNSGDSEIAPLIFQFYGLNYLISKIRKEHNDIVPEKYISLHSDYEIIIDDMSKKIFSYIFINSFIETFFCTEFSNATKQFLEQKFINYDVFNTELSYKEFSHHIKSKDGQIIIQSLIDKFVPNHLINDKNQKNITSLFQEILFNNQNIYSSTVSEMADEILMGYSLNNFKSISIEDICEIFQSIFNNGTFENKYGGSKWNNILKHLQDFTKGHINLEIFIDQAFSLEHNNGSLFSKPNIFKSSENFNLLLQNNNFSFQDKFINFNQLILNSQHNNNVFIISENNYSPLLSDLKNNSPEQFDNISQFKIFQNYIKKNCHDFLYRYKEIIPQSNDIDILSMFNQTSKWNPYFQSINTQSKNNPFIFHVCELKDINSLNLHQDRVGNKAFGISQLIDLNITTPKGLVFDTLTCKSYLQKPEKFIQVFNNKFSELSYIFGDNNNASMVSVRSGAPSSMPGMMDTILNVGIDDENYNTLCIKYGKETIDTCSTNFMTAFLKSFNIDSNISHRKNMQKNLTIFRQHLINLDIPHHQTTKQFPLDRKMQMSNSIQQVFKSWNSERAIKWRQEKNISHDLGTACIIQQMVLGNLNQQSMTGVIFSSDCITGHSNIIGEYVVQQQGDDLVSGNTTPNPIIDMKIKFPHIYNELHHIAKLLETTHQEIKDIEFTVEDNQVFILQQRKAVLSAQAQINLYKNKSPFVKNIDISLLTNQWTIDSPIKPHIQGKCAQAGIIYGIIIEHEDDKVKYLSEYEKFKNQYSHNFGWILSTEKSNPEHLPLLLKSNAFITKTGGYTCHAAIIARSLNKPCIVGTGEHDLISGDIVTMNADTGHIWKNIQPISNNNNESVNFANEIITLFNQQSENIIHKTYPNNKTWIELFPKSQTIHIQPKNEITSVQKNAMIILKTQKHKKIK